MAFEDRLIFFLLLLLLQVVFSERAESLSLKLDNESSTSNDELISFNGVVVVVVVSVVSHTFSSYVQHKPAKTHVDLFIYLFFVLHNIYVKKKHVLLAPGDAGLLMTNGLSDDSVNGDLLFDDLLITMWSHQNRDFLEDEDKDVVVIPSPDTVMI